MKKITLYQFFEMLKKFSNTQGMLIAEFLKAPETQTEWPKHGKVTINGKIWEFRKHGAGICFTNTETKEEIDVHKGLESAPYSADEWRLETYFTSLERITVSHDQIEFDLHTKDGLRKLMRTLQNSSITIPIDYETIT